MKASTFKAWVKKQYSPSELRDLVKQGAVGGFSGMVYYSETAKLYERYSDDLWEMLLEDAETIGVTPLALMSGFNGAAQVETDAQFKNLLVWYGAERVAAALV